MSQKWNYYVRVVNLIWSELNFRENAAVYRRTVCVVSIKRLGCRIFWCINFWISVSTVLLSSLSSVSPPFEDTKVLALVPSVLEEVHTFFYRLHTLLLLFYCLTSTANLKASRSNIKIQEFHSVFSQPVLITPSHKLETDCAMTDCCALIKNKSRWMKINMWLDFFI